MKYKFICCEVFMREACLAIANTNNTIDPEFTPKGAHEESKVLRELIQKKIDETEVQEEYDAILLGFGLCGNSTEGIRARSIPLVMPRAHDCCTIFLGSKEKFIEHFKDNLSKEWSSTGYMERGSSYLRDSDLDKTLGFRTSYEEFVELYGEENADYLWETLHPKIEDNELIFIDIPETSKLRYSEKLKEFAEKEGKTVKVLQGDMRLIRKLVDGEWDEEEFLIVQPGKMIKSQYDYEKVVSSVD